MKTTSAYFLLSGVFELNLLYSQQPLVVNPQLAVAIGLNEAIVLQQIHYWATRTKSGKVHDGRVWIYNTYEQWVEQFPFWSQETVKRALTSLRKKGLIDVAQLNKTEHDRTNYYSINHDHSDLIEQVNMTSSTGSKRPDLTETTTETTTITPKVPASGDDESEKPKSGHAIKNADYTVEDVVELYNEVCGELLPRCNAINDSRIRSARKLSQLKLVNGKQPFIDGGLDAWKVYFAKAISNPFNTGNNDRAWKANFDYLMREAKALMILGI